MKNKLTTHVTRGNFDLVRLYVSKLTKEGICDFKVEEINDYEGGYRITIEIVNSETLQILANIEKEMYLES